MNGARIAVIGLARSGLSVARAASRLGARVTVLDQKPEDKLKAEFLAEARELGAEVIGGWTGSLGGAFDLIVPSPAVPKGHPALQEAVASGVPVFSEVEFAYRISPAPIVAITGTNGKSTTTAMTYEALKAEGKKAILCGNIYGSGYDEIPLTEAASNADPDQVLVAEISSFQLEWVTAFRPIAAAITNITPDHLDRHETFEDYAAAKQRIFGAQGTQDFAILRRDDPVVKKPPIPQLLTFGPKGEHAALTEDDLLILSQTISRNEFSFVGDYNFHNASVALLLTAATLAHGGGKLAAPQAGIQRLQGFKGIAHRMEVVGEKGGVKVINNSMCTNPAAVISSSGSIRAKQHLLIGGSNKKLDFKPLQNYLESSYNKAYLFGRDAESLNEQLGGGHPVYETMAEAFQAAVRNANAGEVIMLAPGCASMDQFEDFRDRGNVFKTIAKEWLES